MDGPEAAATKAELAPQPAASPDVATETSFLGAMSRGIKTAQKGRRSRRKNKPTGKA